ncbi:hypothetical protein CP985_01740 [Malaciobacter mytili LMG 24559]|uniref:AB hydrolase-1 domain-containing protein n=1 Tax=Malaciobacter mytili LMG 24559 TaxID=1032238 RepID=A0AAX2AKQ3_9BACT|nr:alpha/beta hydrolase [Malaciobacter mytili]RXK16905.1 hypothetical protein CP985_01740 [Malaciobacter mytili LMG 24559]
MKKIYLISGFMCDKRLWDKALSFFDSSYKFIYLPIPLEENFEKLLEKIVINEEKINLIGFSLGGYIASAYALKYKDKINKVLVISSSLCSLEKKELLQRQKAIELTKKFAFKSLSEKKIKTLLEDKNNQEIITLIKKMYEELGKEYFLTQLNATLHRKDLKEELLKSKIDFSFYFSKDDILLNHLWLEELELNSSFNFTKLKRSSHMLPLEEPLKIALYIKSWLA